MLIYIAYNLYVIMNIYLPIGGADNKNFYDMLNFIKVFNTCGGKNVYDLNLVKVYID